jgi:hypothetical protein
MDFLLEVVPGSGDNYAFEALHSDRVLLCKQI